MTKLVVGLGNPGPRFSHTRHNAGFAVISELGHRHGARARAQGPSLVGQATIAGQKVVLAEPTTMMNLSGRAVAQLRRAHFVKDLLDLLVVVDDMDIPVGTIRLRDRGGSGGHNGLKSIIDAVGSQEFARLRVGVGRPPPRWDPMDHVLARFRPDEQPIFEESVLRAADAVECWIELGSAEAMNRFNRPG